MDRTIDSDPEGMSESVNVRMNVMQLNCMHSYLAMCDLTELVLEEGMQVALLQEPYVHNARVCGLPMGTRVFLSESERACVAVFDPGYECMLVEECKFKDGVCVWVKGDVGEMYVVSLYCGVKEHVDRNIEYMDGVIEFANGKCVLVCMDANATSALWSSKNRVRYWHGVKRGEKLEEWMLRKGMNVLNTPSPAYTFCGPSGQSDIDVALFGGRGFEFKWELHDEWSVSDHNPVVIIVSRETPGIEVQGNNRVKWREKKCKWTEYECYIESFASGFGYQNYLNLGAEDQVRMMCEWINEANDKCMKRVTARRVLKSAVWWNGDLERKKKEVRRKRKGYQKARRETGDIGNVKWNEWKECVKEYRDMITEAKEGNWKEFVRKEGNRDPWGRVYKMCMGKFEKMSMSVLKTGDAWTKDWKETGEVLLNEFFPPDDGIPVARGIEQGCDGMYEFDMDEVKDAVRRMSVGKAPGMDGISNRMIKSVFRAIPLYVKAMYDGCLNEGVFPKEWKEARVVTLLKGPDKDKIQPRSYRPISLLSGLGKVLERMLVGRLMKCMEGKWNESQFGFMEGKGTEDAMERMRQIVSQDGNKYVAGGFVDFKGAFDFILWRYVLERLRVAGCANEELRIWHDYFKDRWVCMYNSMDEVRKKVARGCPQGSIGGPPIWNLGLNELLDELSGMNVRVIAYADDVLVLVGANTRKELENRMGEIMKVIYGWGKRAGVSVSDEKTVCMMLKGGLDMVNRRVHVCIGRDEEKLLKFVEGVKYLGVWITRGMKYKEHLENQRERVQKKVGRIRRVLRKDWGLKKGVVNVIVKGMIVPLVMYAASAWYELMRLKGMREELNRCHRIVVYACTRVCRTVPTEAMQVIAGSLPWDLECVRLANRYKVRKGLAMNDLDLVSDNDWEGRDRCSMYELVDERARDVWQRRWDESDKGRVTHEWIKDVTFSERTKLFEPSLRVCYLLTGYGSLNDTLFKRNLSLTPACVCGCPNETWLHVLCECDMYAHFRELDEMGVVKRANGWDVSEVLSTKETYERLCVFAERAFKMRASVIARGNVRV